MIEKIEQQLNESAELKRALIGSKSREIAQITEAIIRVFKTGNKLLICGNGGSAADAQHLAAEMVGRFLRERAALPAIALTTDTSILTAIGNDYGYEKVFARQVEALGKPGDALVLISTSGHSANLSEAAKEAGKKNMQTIALLGKDGGDLVNQAGIAIVVPSRHTARIQEAHTTIVHIICDLVEEGLFSEGQEVRIKGQERSRIIK